MDVALATTMPLLQRPGVDLKCKFATYSPGARTAHLPTIAREICNEHKASMLVQESTRLYCHPRSGLLAVTECDTCQERGASQRRDAGEALDVTRQHHREQAPRKQADGLCQLWSL
jgi:hypothetical protein